MWQYNKFPTGDEFYHHGIKGQKWGVRRTKEELARDANSIESRIRNLIKRSNGAFKTKSGIVIKEISQHSTDRIRQKDRTVTFAGVVDALTNPINDEYKRLRIDEIDRPSYRYVGKVATVNINPENGRITTIWKTSSKVKGQK